MRAAAGVWAFVAVVASLFIAEPNSKPLAILLASSVAVAVYTLLIQWRK